MSFQFVQKKMDVYLLVNLLARDPWKLQSYPYCERTQISVELISLEGNMTNYVLLLIFLVCKNPPDKQNFSWCTKLLHSNFLFPFLFSFILSLPSFSADELMLHKYIKPFDLNFMCYLIQSSRWICFRGNIKRVQTI